VTLRVVGAGLGRTGTHCYHMFEVVTHPDHIPVWQAAVDGDPVDWDALFDGYAAAVDWPVAAFWREISDQFPDAIVLLSSRDTAGWWKSAHSTIFEIGDRPISDDPVFGPHQRMVNDMLERRFTPGWREEVTATAAYEAHNAAVRAAVRPERLVEWHPGDGWAPICAALELPVPSEPFPHANTTADFRQLTGLD
jgi:hypothetical protein